MCNVENVQHHIPPGGMCAMWRMWGMSSITFHPEECVQCGECGECPASHSTRRNALLCGNVENVGNVQYHIPLGGMRRMWRMWRMSSITLHLEGWLCNRPSDWLIPSDGCVMLQQTKWEGVVQMILRNCVYLVQNRPNFTVIWVISVYVVLGHPAVLAQNLMVDASSAAHSSLISFPSGFSVKITSDSGSMFIPISYL